MNKTNSYNRLIIIGIIILLLISNFSIIGFSIDPSIDKDDGVYYIDKFYDGINVNLENCIISDDNNEITLDPYVSNISIYDFSTWTTNSEHKAYYYTTPFNIFYPAYNEIIPIFENEFDPNIDYEGLRRKNDNEFCPPDIIEGQSPVKIVHHFRFKINQDINSTTQLDIYWRGKTKNVDEITLYYWQPIGNFGLWIEDKTINVTSTIIDLQQSFAGDLFISNDKYVDICIVSKQIYGEISSLYTDYVNVTAYGHGYSNGIVTSEIIDPINIDRWERLVWDDYETSGTSIIYHIFYENDTGHINLVEENYLDGNENGFSSPPVYLDSLPSEYKIKIKANLTTNDLSITPKINNWGIIWQTQEYIWRDKFNFSFRIDEKNNVYIKNLNVSLIPSISDWPMFGQNPSNTRSSEGEGPDANNHDIKWYSFQTGGGYRNPVIKDEILYISSLNGRDLYAFEATVEPEGTTKQKNAVIQVNIPENKTINSSPAITNNNIVIVATGTPSVNGNVENKVYAYDTTNILSKDPEWIFKYGDIDQDNPYICFSSSPTISNDKIFLSSWSGDSSIWNLIWEYFNFTSGNNKLIALDFDGNFEWEYDLPAGSFSSPAVYNDKVIVGCENKNGNSIFALNIDDGEELWKKSVGPIGGASPVIDGEKVFVVAKESASIPFTAYTNVFALNLNNGEKIWNISIGDSTPDNYELTASSTPTIYNNVLFVASSDGTLYALNTNNGNLIWSEKIYTKSLISSHLLSSSPAYADDMVYIGTPDGKLYAIDASDGNIVWDEETYSSSPMLSSPIVTDGFIFDCSEIGVLYCRGKLQGVVSEQVGSLVSIPIKLPDPSEDYIWDKLHVNYSTSKGNIDFSILNENKNELLSNIDDNSNISTNTINNYDTIRLYADFIASTDGEAILYDWSVSFKNASEPSHETVFYKNSFSSRDIPPICTIDVKNEHIGLWNTSSKYRFEYDNQSGKYTTEWLTANCSGINGSTVKEIINANLSHFNPTDNITQYWKIQFSIKDVGIGKNETRSEWFDFLDIEYPDIAKPIFFNDSFTPIDGWISTNTPICTIESQDIGTEGNITGLNISSAGYTLKYKDQSVTKTYIGAAQCNGTNGTMLKETLTADISKLDFSENITELKQIKFYIEDMSGNSNNSEWFDFQTDNEKPFSWITNSATIPNPSNTTPITINATAEDNISSIKYVKLYYRISGDTEWSFFSPIDYTPPYTWSFSIGRNDGGEYELCTIATDNATNVEDYPSQGDVSFIFDPNNPYKPVFDNEYRFTNDTIPEFSIEFRDDYKLKSVEYRLNFEGYNEWTKINDEDINTISYFGEWNLSQDDWDYMLEDIDYYIYFKLTDSLGNQYESKSNNEAMNIIKDLIINIIETPYDPDISDFYEWNWDNVFLISVNINESEVSKIELHYRYSSDHKTWNNWTQYETSLNASPFEWNFTAKNGSGYYEFKTFVWDESNQYHESDIKSVSITLFPTILVIIMIVFMIILLIVTTFFLNKMKKKKT